MKLSVVIPAYNEEGCIEGTVRSLYQTLEDSRIPHEIVVVDDNSRDSTAEILERLRQKVRTLRVVFNPGPNGFGMAIRKGLDSAQGDAIAIFMADSSDSPRDLVRFYYALNESGVDCVFGTRWTKASKVVDYPIHKRILNRLANTFIRVLFGLAYNDVTNAFKLYRKDTLDGLRPFLSVHFNLTVELPLKAIVRGYSYTVLPNDWANRKAGVSKLRLKEMGSRYLFIVLYCLLEKWLSRGDYLRKKRRPGEAATMGATPLKIAKM